MHIGILIALILVIAVTLRLGILDHFKWSEPFQAHTAYVAESGKKLSPLTNTLNLTNPVLPLDGITADNVAQALSTATAQPLGPATYGLLPRTQTLPTQLPAAFQQAQACEAAPKSCAAFDDPTFAQNCGLSFDINSTAMDGHVVAGSGLYVSPDDRAQALKQFEDVERNGTAPFDPYLVAKPTLGTAKAGTFALNKAQCTVVKEKLDCAAKQTFGVPNCTQCYTTQAFSRVGPQTGRLPSKIHFFGAGRFAISSPSHPSLTLAPRDLSKDTPATIELPAAFEGQTFTATLTDNGARPLYLSGWLEGPTSRGPFKLDAQVLVKTDTQTGARPRLSGSQVAGGFRCLSMIPGAGKTSMTLTMYMPFTFINGFDGDAMACENGPVVTLAESATFLESDPCYSKANQPGNYTAACLQSRWIELGGTPQGTGYPSTQQAMNTIQRGAAGQARTIDDIADTLGVKAARAYGGTDERGQPLSLSDWNAVSMEMTGVPINTPCDGPANAAGTPSPACLSYLYRNQGASSRVGPTYSQNPGRVASSKEAFQGAQEPKAAQAQDPDPSLALLHGGESFLDDQFKGMPMLVEKKTVIEHAETFRDLLLKKADVVQKFVTEALHTEESFANAPTAPVFNYPGTTIDPATPQGQAFAKKFQSITDVKNAYDQINRTANDNTLTNDQRRTEVKQAYGIELGAPSSSLTPSPPQVYAAGIADGGYVYTRDQGEAICQALGGTTATTAQLQDAQAHGADWCFSGWTTEGKGKWPITTSVVGGCGGRTGVIEWTPGDKAGVNCFGPKPDSLDPRAKNILPFNQQMWDQPREPTWLTIPTGYLETTGPQPSCFNGLSVEAAQKGCQALGDRCVGFSYSKDGRGNGCYKGNHNAGINTNPNYMGYVKVGAAAAQGPPKGRYIKMQWDRVECLNLLQIRVFSSREPNAPNLITPNTVVTKSSGYQGDVFPVKNFVDGKEQIFVHTSCYDVPWIQVDLGSEQSIAKVVIVNRKDCCLARILGATLSILDADGSPVYTSAAISSVHQTYTFYPTDPAPRGDVPEDAIKAPKAGPWTCLPGMPSPMRKNQNGDVECMSPNHHDCIWTSDALCARYRDNPPPSVDPLVCGAMHQREWGGPGYDNPGHWCARARGELKQG